MSDKMSYRYFMPLFCRTQEEREDKVRELAGAFPSRHKNPKLRPFWLDISQRRGGITRTVFLVVE